MWSFWCQDLRWRFGGGGVRSPGWCALKGVGVGGVGISQAPIDKRQMDLHGSALFRMGKKKRSEGARRPAIVFLRHECCRKQRSIPHL